MAKWKVPSDTLMDAIMGRAQFVTVNDVKFDPVTRDVIFDITGSDVPDIEGEVILIIQERNTGFVPAANPVKIMQEEPQQ